ncbi:hypothetical protein ASG73_01025 [Janibacter sp. Soil728]|uniref:hypothetical protein n=1 Tax=Janibacter sp. Soil728 TaxID=1736393 RepID=UPI0006F48DF3|nr:hypothetical protein [Janibacter sp. Soil728]KRE38980.1 hypothetical protein ASG73_01025 [Janibacter sp. Soil728]
MTLRTIVVVGVLALALSACSTISFGGQDPTEDLPSPGEAMQQAGLDLPAGASDVTITSSDLPDREHAWALTFTAPRAEAEAICEPMGGVGRQSFVPKMHQELLGDVEAGPQTRGCSASTGNGGLWGRFVLIEPGDPAMVHVSLQQLTR